MKLTKRLWWLIYLLPFMALMAISLDFAAIYVEGTLAMLRQVVSLSAVAVCLIYVFKLEYIFQYKYFLPYFVLVVVDEWPEFLLGFDNELSWYLTVVTLVPEFIILTLCLLSVKTQYRGEVKTLG